jgi:hypothetical protein
MERLGTDAAVAAIHAVAAGCVFGLEPTFRATTAGTLLFWMEMITISFHALYTVAYTCAPLLLPTDRANPYKWLEVAFRFRSPCAVPRAPFLNPRPLAVRLSTLLLRLWAALLWRTRLGIRCCRRRRRSFLREPA